VPSAARIKFDENKRDVDQLWQIHEEIGGQGPGRKYGVDVINRASIVFITACWESFIEDLAVEAFDFLVVNVPNALALPSKVRDLATKALFEQKDSRRVWDLADAGWRKIIANHRAATLERWVDTLNTPKTAQVNRLFEELVGFSNVSAQWHWQNMSQAQAEAKLDQYISIRGNIAHRTEHNETIYKNWIADYVGHVSYLVDQTEIPVAAHLVTLTGKQPW
jgi:hypothetical protein